MTRNQPYRGIRKWRAALVTSTELGEARLRRGQTLPSNVYGVSERTMEPPVRSELARQNGPSSVTVWPGPFA